MEKILIILRGLPSSGKSSFALLLNTKAICCADDYFIHKGKYLWKPQKISKAHEWCQRKCKRFMEVGAERIVISNTNTTAKEMLAYYGMTYEFNYKVFSVVVENRHNGTNVHNVPAVTLNKMKERFEIQL